MLRGVQLSGSVVCSQAYASGLNYTVACDNNKHLWVTTRLVHGNGIPMENVPWDGTARIAFPMGPMRQ